MSSAQENNYVGLRVRCQRLRDAKIFNGWIESFGLGRVEISTEAAHPPEAGDEFHFQVASVDGGITFRAAVDSCAAYDLRQAVVVRTEGSSAVKAFTTKILVRMSLTTPVRPLALAEGARIKLPEFLIELEIDGQKLPVLCVDGSTGGLGVVAGAELERDKVTHVTIRTRVGTIEGEAEVRYCRADPNQAGGYRIGLMWTNVDRINRTLWNRFLREV